MEPEYIYEGGQCRPYPIQGTKKNKAGRITFEKGHGYLNPFFSKNGFTAGSRISLPCSIIITDNNNKPLRIFLHLTAECWFHGGDIGAGRAQRKCSNR